MDWTDRRERLRAIVASGRCIHPGSVHDPISARIAEDLGFEAGMFAGSVASLAVLGAPDIVVLTLTEFADQAYRINRAGKLPLLVDADHGYGNALNVKRTVEELETAGVAGLTIEDTLLLHALRRDRNEAHFDRRGRRQAEGGARRAPGPAPRHRRPHCGADDHRRRRHDRALQGLCGGGRRHAVHGRREEPRRARRGRRRGDEAAVSRQRRWKSRTDRHDQFAARNVRICLQGHAPFNAAVNAIHATLKALRDGTPSWELQNISPPSDLLRQATRAADYAAWTKDFLDASAKA